MTVKTSISLMELFVGPSDSSIEKLCEAIKKTNGVNGALDVHPPDECGHHWASGRIGYRGLSFFCMIASKPIDCGETPAELTAVRENDGATDTYSLRCNDFDSLNLSENEAIQICRQFFRDFLVQSNSLEFNGKYMRVDYQW